MAVVVTAALMAGGAVVAWLAARQTSVALLVLAGALLLGGIAGVTVLALRGLHRPLPRAAAIVGAVALGVALFVPASMSTSVDRCGQIGSGNDLSSCDLSGRDLSGQDLHGTDLSSANLSGADLSGANLEDAAVTGANLRGADLSDARLPGVTARDTDLRDAKLSGAALAGADLTGAVLTGAVLADADLGDAVLTGLDLTGSDMGGADLSGADLSGAVLADTALTGATLEGADLRNADLSGADLTGASAAAATFDGATFTRTYLESNDFVGATGITDEALVAALGMSADRLPGATARRGIQLDRFEDVVAAVTPVTTGGAVPAARNYAPSGEFHPAVVLDPTTTDATSPGLADTVQSAWAPTGLRYAELVVVVEPQTWDTIEVCEYTSGGVPAPPITRYTASVNVRVLASHDGRVVTERSFRGTDPRACLPSEPYSLSELRGDPPDLAAQAQPWLATLVNPPAERAAQG